MRRRGALIAGANCRIDVSFLGRRFHQEGLERSIFSRGTDNVLASSVGMRIIHRQPLLQGHIGHHHAGGSCTVRSYIFARVCTLRQGIYFKDVFILTDDQDHSAALALVSVHKDGLEQHTKKGEQDDLDMQRATDLLDLHYGLKMAYKHGNDENLSQARRQVDVVLKGLGNKDDR